MPALVLALSLLAILVAVAAGFAWQERNRRPEAAVIYGVDDAVEYVYPRLSDTARAGLRRSDVRRILEWELEYLQNPKLRDGDGEPAVVGGMNAARYAQEGLTGVGHSYDGPMILEVLELQARYLAAIGAVGKPVSNDEGGSVLRRSGEFDEG